MLGLGRKSGPDLKKIPSLIEFYSSERIQNTNEITRERVTGDQKLHKVRMI